MSTEHQNPFSALGVVPEVVRALQAAGYEQPTPIQAQCIPALVRGQDVLGQAQTGTGKTAAFLITVLTRLLNNPIQGKRKPGTPRVLILAPTRELVLQISEEARKLSATWAMVTVRPSAAARSAARAIPSRWAAG